MDFADEFINNILAQEMPKINKIIEYMAEETRKDLYNKTVALLDTYYWGYTKPPRKYVRTDDFKRRLDKNGRLHNKKGYLKKMSKTALEKRDDISLRTAIQNGESSISFMTPLDNGYSAGIIFSEDYFENESNMIHHNKGISEWDITQNFLFSNQNGVGNWALRSPSADAELQAFIDNYDSRMDRHYKVACDKFR